MRRVVLIALALVPVGACQSRQDQGPIQKLSEAEAQALNAQYSRFETSEDPPFTAETHFAAGQLAESQGLVAKAIEQYRQALKIDPRHQKSLYRLGILYTQTRQYPQALEVWRQYVKACNGSATALSNLGFCYELAGQLAEAERAYKMGIEREPANQPCRVNYGLMLARSGRIEQAVSQLSAVLKPAEVHYNLGSVYEQLGRKEQAEAEYRKALELDPQFWEARARLAKLR